MDSYQEQKYQSQATQQQANMGTCGELRKDSPRLRDRVAERLRQCERQASKANSLSELLRLLDKNPDVALILTLMEDM